MEPDRVLRPFLDQRCRPKSWPMRRPKRIAARAYLAAKFDADRDYAERQVNELLDRWHAFGDHTLLRRARCDQWLLSRTPAADAVTESKTIQI